VKILKIEECFEILKEKIEHISTENIENIDTEVTLQGIQEHEDKLTKSLSRITYDLDDGEVYIFLQSGNGKADANTDANGGEIGKRKGKGKDKRKDKNHDKNEVIDNEPLHLKKIKLYAKINESGTDVLKHQDSREILSYEKNWN